MDGLVFPTKAQQISLLEEVLNTGADSWETSDHYMRLNNGKHQKVASRGAQNVKTAAPVQRFTAPLEHLSGGQNLSYREQNKSANKELQREERLTKKQRVAQNAGQHSVFKKRQNELASAKKRMGQ